MKLRSITYLTSVLALSSILHAEMAGPSDLKGLSSTFSVDRNTQIPGETLKPGEYAIHVVDYLNDRIILRVDSPTSKAHAIFLGVPGTSETITSDAGPISWANGPNKTPAFRGFSFSAGPVVEFVYPKAEAAQLAKLNAAKVVAVDPESEALPKLANLSHDELVEVNLWLLSLTSTGQDNQKKTPAILAQKYQIPSQPSQPVLARTNLSPEPQTTQVASLDQSEMTSAARVPKAAQPRPAKRAPVVSVLPHTGSDLPLVGLLGFFSLMAALVLRLLRSANSSSLA